MTEREHIHLECYRMKVGERAILPRRLFNVAFPCGYPSIYQTSIQAFLSGMIGSGCGVWRAEQDPETGDIMVSRHEESKKRYYVDPDREHLFKRVEDGSLERR